MSNVRPYAEIQAAIARYQAEIEKLSVLRPGLRLPTHAKQQRIQEIVSLLRGLEWVISETSGDELPILDDKKRAVVAPVPDGESVNNSTSLDP